MSKFYNIQDLMPLYLFSGWIVVKNVFFDVEPPQSGETSENEQYFGEDLLALKYNKGTYDVEAHNASEPLYYIWLGWYPEYSVEGHYVLTASCNDEMIARFEARDRKKINRVI